MWKNRFALAITGPTILVSLLLLALCSLAALYLNRQQETSADILDENVSSTQVAHDMKNTLADLAALLRGGGESVDPLPLHERLRDQLTQARALADKDEERQLVGQLDSSLDRYFQLWDSRRSATAALKPEIRKSETAHRATVQWVVGGLLGVGVVGAVAGVLLGYSVARRLRHSIYHLSVRVQDAATKLGQDLPAVAVEEDGDLHLIQEQMKTIVHDIEQVVQKLQQREREVLRAEQLAALGQLAAGVAHEIRNPLTSIKMLVQTLGEDLDARGAAAEDLQIIELEIRRMERSLQTFLDYARPPKPDFRPLDLAEPVRRTLDLIGGRARKQKVALEFTPPPAPVTVTADAEQIQQLLVNLTLNALDVMPRGGTLHIDLRQAGPAQAELCVRDTGPGIAVKVLPTLFQPFVSTKETGLGLGLVTSRRIAESHGGTLAASNQLGGGACFTLRLAALVEAPLVR